MANSRLERIGTIYTRITGLLRAGAMKMEDKPIWYDVYQKFPPKYPPKFEKPVPNLEVRNIFYPEDNLRARIHKEKASIIGVVNLSDTSYQTNTQKCISRCEELQADGSNLDDALEKAVEQVASERSIRREDFPKTASIADEFKKARSINIREIIKGD